MRKLLPVVISGAMLSFSQIAFAQTGHSTQTESGAYTDSNPSANTRYNIHQRGDQNSTQFGEQNQSSQIQGDENQVNQQSGDASVSTQQGADSQSSTTYQSGSGNTAATTQQEGTQNQSAIGSGNQQSQQMGSGHQSDQTSSMTEENEYNRQRGDRSAAAGGTSADDDDDHPGKGKAKGNPGNENRGWHKGWENPERSGSTRY